MECGPEMTKAKVGEFDTLPQVSGSGTYFANLSTEDAVPSTLVEAGNSSAIGWNNIIEEFYVDAFKGVLHTLTSGVRQHNRPTNQLNATGRSRQRSKPMFNPIKK